MNLTINRSVLYDTSKFFEDYEGYGPLLNSELLKWGVDDVAHVLAQKHNGLCDYIGNNRDLRTTHKNDIVGAINEIIDLTIKYSLIFGT